MRHVVVMDRRFRTRQRTVSSPRPLSTLSLTHIPIFARLQNRGFQGS